jgi:hypothetical protein
MLASHADLARKFDALEQKYDARLKLVFDAIRELTSSPETKSKQKIGFPREGARPGVEMGRRLALRPRPCESSSVPVPTSLFRLLGC